MTALINHYAPQIFWYRMCLGWCGQPDVRQRKVVYDKPGMHIFDCTMLLMGNHIHSRDNNEPWHQYSLRSIPDDNEECCADYRCLRIAGADNSSMFEAACGGTLYRPGRPCQS